MVLRIVTLNQAIQQSQSFNHLVSEGAVFLGNQENPADKLVAACADIFYCSVVTALPLPPVLDRSWLPLLKVEMAEMG